MLRDLSITGCSLVPTLAPPTSRFDPLSPPMAFVEHPQVSARAHEDAARAAARAPSRAPRCIPGEHVDLVLHLPDQRALWLGAVIRRDDDGAIALTFEKTGPRTEDRLQDLVVEVYTRMHADTHSFSLVIDPRSDVRQGLLGHLEQLGERAIGVATPLDAVQLLLERGDYVQTAFIGPVRPEAPSLELIEFLARSYPRVRRVLLGNALEVAEAWRAEARGEVHGLLETPCSEHSLRRLVHRISTLPSDSLS
jgi:hypothetical protein